MVEILMFPKSNGLQVDIFQFILKKKTFRHILQIPLKMMGNFPEVLNFNRWFLKLNRFTGSPVISGRLFPFIVHKHSFNRTFVTCFEASLLVLFLSLSCLVLMHLTFTTLATNNKLYYTSHAYDSILFLYLVTCASIIDRSFKMGSLITPRY